MRLPFDKKLHVAFGFFIGMTTMLVLKDFGFTKNQYIGISVFVTFLIAVAKEIYDKATGKGTFEKADIFYTMLGCSAIIFYEFIKTII